MRISQAVAPRFDMIGLLVAVVAAPFGRKQGVREVLVDDAPPPFVAGRPPTVLTRANAATQALLALTELDDRQAGRQYMVGSQCAGRVLPWSTALGKTVLGQGQPWKGPASACAQKCDATAACQAWEWCGCKPKPPRCPGCLLFSGQHAAAWMASDEGFIGAARGEECDFTSEDRCDDAPARPPAGHEARRVVIAHNINRPWHLLRDVEAAVVPAVRAARLDVAELAAWGMVSDAAYSSLVGGGRAHRVRQSIAFAQLLSHARAWKKVVELDEVLVVVGEGDARLALRGLPPWSIASQARGAARIEFVEHPEPPPAAASPPSRAAAPHGAFPPPYAITPQAAHVLYAHLWGKFYDQVDGAWLDTTHAGSAGPSTRHLGLLAFMREVCSRAKMECALPAAAGGAKPPPGHVSVPRVLYVPPDMPALTATPPPGWEVRPLGSAAWLAKRSWAAACALQLRTAGGGVCVLTPGVVLPPNLDLLIAGVTRFAVAQGRAISTSIFGCAPPAAAAFPPYESEKQFAEAMTQRMRTEVSFEKVVYAHSLFWPRSRAPIPKVLHFIQLGPKDLKAYTARAVLTWLATHPAWLVRLWTDSDLKGMQLAPAIAKARKYPQKADIMRTELLYRHGGLYVDSDFEAFGPIDPWLRNTSAALCNEEDVPGDTFGAATAISNGFIAVAPLHPVMRRAVVRIQHATLNRQWINQDTGPFFLRTMLDDADLPYLRKIPTRIMFPVKFSGKKKLVAWGCYQKSCSARFPADTVGVHLWSQEGAGWSAAHKRDDLGSLQKQQGGCPRLEHVQARILEHNAQVKTKGGG